MDDEQSDCGPDDLLDAMNCFCNGPIVLTMGIERCAVCGHLAGEAAFRPFGGDLPSPATERARVHATPGDEQSDSILPPSRPSGQ
jgi:hypothetical protein